MRRKATYMLCENNELELPVLVTDDMQEVADYLGTNKGRLYANIARHMQTVGKDHRYKIVRLYLDD